MKARDRTTLSWRPTEESTTPDVHAPPSHRGRRNRSILLIVLGVLILAVAGWAIANRAAAPPAPGPSASGGPAASATGSAPAQTSPPVTPTLAALPSHYTAVQLPRLAGSTQYGTAGFAINEQGLIVGQSETATGRPHAVLWRDGRLTDLGVLAPGPDELSIARDINARGDIVGGSNTPGAQRAVLWRDGQIIDLGTLGGVRSFAYAINDRGQIVGTSEVASGEAHGFLWEDGRMRDLGLAGVTWPSDINNAGQVIGITGVTASGAGRPFVWQNGTSTMLPMPVATGSARQINDQGEIVGAYDRDDSMHAVRWFRGAMTELGNLPGGNASNAVAINAQGQILGGSNVAAHATGARAVIWWKGGLHDLTPAGLSEEAGNVANDINDRGQILSGGTLYNPDPLP